jgi:hypothetical protein
VLPATLVTVALAIARPTPMPHETWTLTIAELDVVGHVELACRGPDCWLLCPAGHPIERLSADEARKFAAIVASTLVATHSVDVMHVKRFAMSDTRPYSPVMVQVFDLPRFLSLRSRDP